ncbi:MAG: hypothetical protein ACXAC7_21015 [Candidatus Hodarchaeales archaeon]|jgi:hypothetical protein
MEITELSKDDIIQGLNDFNSTDILFEDAGPKIIIIPKFNEKQGYFVDKETFEIVTQLQKDLDLQRQTLKPISGEQVNIRDQRCVDFTISVILIGFGIKSIILKLLDIIDKRINAVVEVDIKENLGKNKFRSFIKDRYTLKLSEKAQQYVDDRDYAVLTTQQLYFVYMKIKNEKNDKISDEILKLLTNKKGLITNGELGLD